MASHRVGLPQVRETAVSERIALRLPLPAVVVTWFITGSLDFVSDAPSLDTAYIQSTHG